MAGNNADILRSMHSQVVDELVASRHAIDDAFGTLPVEEIRQRFARIHQQMERLIDRPPGPGMDQVVAEWVSALMGAGLTPRTILRTLVTFGDLIVQVTKQHLPPGLETHRFVRDVVRLNFHVIRSVCRLLNDELMSRAEPPGGGAHGP